MTAQKPAQSRDPRPPWTKATLGTAARAGDPISIWCNNGACRFWCRHGRQYRAVLSPADLEALAERYGDGVTWLDFRARLRCRYCGSADVSTIVERPYVSPAERGDA